jgi:hypothetical protein
MVRSLTTSVTGLQGQPPADHPHGYPFLASIRYTFVAICFTMLFLYLKCELCVRNA